jgi:hypothetical protein
VIGGAHIGYNLQINQWVVGLEGTVDGTSLSGSISRSARTPTRGPFGTLAASTVRMFKVRFALAQVSLGAAY